jgi:VCBS repeat-containing protein
VLQVPGYLSVLANDEDIDFGGNPTSAQLVQWPTNGTLNFGADGEITYTPNANFNGTDQFTYQAVDTNGATSNFATVTITVYPVNDFPSVTDETYMLLEDEPQSGNVLANDTDLESNPLSATALDPPAHGSLTLDYSGNFTYTPAANYHGPDSFTYLVSDGWSQVMGTVVLTVTPVNDAPEAIDHSYTTDEDTPLVVNDGEGLKAGAIDADNDVLTFAIVDQPSNGTLSVDSETGAFVYTPNPNFYGTDGFAYAVSDGQALDLATVTLTVSPVNDAPVTNDDAYPIVEDVIYNSTESVLDNDSDLDGDALTAVLVDGPQHGSISLYSNGNFSYESDLSIDGLDFFTYQAFDGTAYSTITTVVLTSVTNGPSNSPPQAENDAFALLEDSSIDFFEVELLANDYDSDPGDVVEFASFIGEPLHGSIVSLGSGVWRYTPSNGYHGSDEIRYLVTDGNYQSTGVVYFTVHRKDVDGGNLFTTVPKLTSFTLWNIPEDREEVPGIGIRRNKDVEAVGTLDDDLLYSGVQFNQSLKLYQTYYTVILRRTSDAIQAWSNQSMITPLYAAGVRDFIFPPQAEHLLNYTFYTEWTSGDANMTRADFDLVFRKPNGDEFISDTLVFHPFKSLVVGFVGEAQSPTDPQVGMHMLINEARYHGFDAMLFDEDDISYDSVFGYLRGEADDIIRPSDYDRANANGGGGTPPRNSIKAIKNAVDNMGVSEIALIGYSHGGGAVLELSSELQLAADKPVGRYTISYAAYIDAVKKQSFVGEDRYPVGASVLVNLYQTGPLAPLRVIQGTSVANIPERAALVEDNVDSGADEGFVYAGVFNQRQHTNRKGRGIAETDEIRNAILFGQWGTYISPFSLNSKVTKF